MSSYRISADVETMDLDLIHTVIAETYWAKGIPRSILERALKNSMCFGMFDESGNQVAFARLVTDYATFAYLADVFVIESHRGLGLSKKMLEEVFNHKELQGLRRLTLATRDAHGLYEKFGFTALNKPDYFMERWDPEVYTRK